MAQIKIESQVVINACDKLLEYLENNPTTVKQKIVGQTDGYWDKKSAVKDIKELAEYGSTVDPVWLDHNDYKLLSEYL